ncbi:hypothetical protein M405DRAFT_818617, partial [Rhizopogon salebrosus TDB-379]
MSARTAERLIIVHKGLQSSPFYIANHQFRENVEWSRQGRGDYVLRTSNGTTSGGLSSETASDDNEPVTLSAVVRISFNDYFFTADAFYRGPSRFTSSLLKPTLTRWRRIWNGYKTPYTSEISTYSFRGEDSRWLIKVHR